MKNQTFTKSKIRINRLKSNNHLKLMIRQKVDQKEQFETQLIKIRCITPISLKQKNIIFNKQKSQVNQNLHDDKKVSQVKTKSYLTLNKLPNGKNLFFSKTNFVSTCKTLNNKKTDVKFQIKKMIDALVDNNKCSFQDEMIIISQINLSKMIELIFKNCQETKQNQISHNFFFKLDFHLDLFENIQKKYFIKQQITLPDKKADHFTFQSSIKDFLSANLKFYQNRGKIIEQQQIIPGPLKLSNREHQSHTLQLLKTKKTVKQQEQVSSCLDQIMVESKNSLNDWQQNLKQNNSSTTSQNISNKYYERKSNTQERISLERIIFNPDNLLMLKYVNSVQNIPNQSIDLSIITNWIECFTKWIILQEQRRNKMRQMITHFFQFSYQIHQILGQLRIEVYNISIPSIDANNQVQKQICRLQHLHQKIEENYLKINLL